MSTFDKIGRVVLTIAAYLGFIAAMSAMDGERYDMSAAFSAGACFLLLIRGKKESTT